MPPFFSGAFHHPSAVHFHPPCSLAPSRAPGCGRAALMRRNILRGEAFRSKAWSSVMRVTAVCVCVAIVALGASGAWSQDNPALPGVQPPATTGVAPPQAPVGHRQPTPKDLPPDLARGQQPADGARGEPETEGAAPRGKNARGRG